MENNCRHNFRMDTEVRPRYKTLSMTNTFFFFLIFILLLKREHKYCQKAALLFGGSAPSEK